MSLRDKKDCSLFVCKIFEQIKEKPIEEVVKILLEAEKETRKKKDTESTIKIVLELLKLDLKENKNEDIRNHMKELSLRQGQMKQVIKEIVGFGIQIINSISDIEEKQKFLFVIKEITQGKMFVELERVRATKQLSEIMEQKNQLKEAADELFEIPIETFGSILKEEKIEFLLRQLYLALKTKDYDRMEQTASKITPKTFEFGYLPEKRILFLLYFSVLLTKKKKYHEAAEVCLSLLNIKELSFSLREIILKNYIWFFVLSGFFYKTKNCLNVIIKEKHLEASPYKSFVSDLIQNELINLSNISVFFEEKDLFLSFVPDFCLDEKRILTEDSLCTFREKIFEYNIRIISKHYSTIYLSSLSSYLSLSEDETESILCKMVLSEEEFDVAIDRPSRVVSFYPEEKENKFSQSVQMIVEKLAKIKRLIA